MVIRVTGRLKEAEGRVATEVVTATAIATTAATIVVAVVLIIAAAVAWTEEVPIGLQLRFREDSFKFICDVTHLQVFIMLGELITINQ